MIHFRRSKLVQLRLISFAKDKTGSAAVEFALVGSLFLTLLLGHVEVGYLLFLQHRLDDATIAASRSIMLGVSQRASDDTVEKFKTNRICPALRPFFDCSRLIVEGGILPDSAPAFDADTWKRRAVGSQSSGQYCLGATGQYMFLRVSYPQRPIVGQILPAGMFSTYGGERVTMLTSYAAWRNEPVEAKKTGPCQ
ncbi:Flp pilus assembly protein TadG [Aureimonas phyllosphaerae]|nr:Flp pilus assembly protein TadG [Aureimonas phyllosphaerae]